MTIGSCLLSNEPSGLAQSMIQRRIEGKSWKEIADEFGLPNPSAARKAFEKATGITDFKIKGQALSEAVKDMSAKAAHTGIYSAKQAVKAAEQAVKEAPAEIAKAITPKWKTAEKMAEEVGLTEAQVSEIVLHNLSGTGYAAIRSNLASKGVTVDFEQIDRVVWNSLLAKHDGKTWQAYLDKPTSKEGFNAVKTKILDLKAKGLKLEEISKIPESPPESVIDAILKDKWTLPTPGSKTPIIPPPPPAPPQVYEGPLKSGTNYRRHSDGEMMKWINELGGDLTQAQLDAVRVYTGSGYQDINSYLRTGNSYGSVTGIEKRVKAIDGAMKPLPFDVEVTRNVHSLERVFQTNDLKGLIGTVFKDKGFVSTTIRESGVFSGNVQMVIKVPKGAKARYVQPISGHKSEYELLLARDTRMVVTRVEEVAATYGQKFRIELEVIV